MNRGLGALLSALAGGASTYADARSEREARAREQAERAAAAQRAQESLALQRRQADQSAAHDAAALAETARQHDTAAAQGWVDRGAQILPHDAPTADQLGGGLASLLSAGLPGGGAPPARDIAALLAPRFGGADRRVVGQAGGNDVVFTEAPETRDARRLREADRIKDENERGAVERRYQAFVGAGMQPAQARAAAVNPSLADNYFFPKADPFALIDARARAAEAGRAGREEGRAQQAEERAARGDVRHAETDFDAMLGRRPRASQFSDPMTRLTDSTAYGDAMQNWRADSTAKAGAVQDARSSLEELLGGARPQPAPAAAPAGGQHLDAPGAVTPELAEYDAAVRRIAASNLPAQEKQRRIAIATERYRAARQR